MINIKYTIIVQFYISLIHIPIYTYYLKRSKKVVVFGREKIIIIQGRVYIDTRNKGNYFSVKTFRILDECKCEVTPVQNMPLTCV